MLLAALAAQAGELPTLVLPPTEAAWVVRIVTSGGFTGRGSGSYTASSAGDVACLAVPACPARLASDTERALSRLVTELPVSTVSPALPSRPTSTCNDCVTTTISVRRRDRAGERTQTFTWDETTRAGVPDSVLRLYGAVIAVAALRSP